MLATPSLDFNIVTSREGKPALRNIPKCRNRRVTPPLDSSAVSRITYIVSQTEIYIIMAFDLHRVQPLYTSISGGC